MINGVQIISLTAVFVLGPLAFGDASYQETSQITGGSLMDMVTMAGVFSSRAKQATAPTLSHVAVHGNRMARANPLTTENH